MFVFFRHRLVLWLLWLICLVGCFLVGPILFHRDLHGISHLRVHVWVVAAVLCKSVCYGLSDVSGSAITSHLHIAGVVTLEDGRGDQYISDHGDANWDVHEVAVVTVVGTLYQGLKLRYVVRVGKVDHIDANIVSLESLAEVLALRQVLVNRVTDEDNDSLPLRLVHSVLK